MTIKHMLLKPTVARLKSNCKIKKLSEDTKRSRRIWNYVNFFFIDIIGCQIVDGSPKTVTPDFLFDFWFNT